MFQVFFFCLVLLKQQEKKKHSQTHNLLSYRFVTQQLKLKKPTKNEIKNN